MAAFNSTFQTDLAKPSRVVPIPDTYTRGDNESHTITVLVYDSANPSCGLMAGSVSAAVARQDGNTIPLTTGTKGAATVPVKLADGSTAQATPCTVTLKQACFDCPGQVVVVIRLVSGETITSIFVGSGKVNEGLTNSIIDPGDVITDITALIAAAEQAAADAQTALAQATAVVSYAEQTGQTDAQKEQARENIGAASEDDVTDLRGAFVDGMLGDVPLLLVHNEYVKNTDGTFAAYNGWSRTGLFYIGNAKTIKITTTARSDYNVFYDSSKTFVSAFVILSGDNTVNIPDGVEYIAMSSTTTAMNDTTVRITETKADADLVLLNGFQDAYTRSLYDTNVSATSAMAETRRWFMNHIFDAGTMIKALNFRWWTGSAVARSFLIEIWEKDGDALTKVKTVPVTIQEASAVDAYTVKRADIGYVSEKPCMVCFLATTANTLMYQSTTGMSMALGSTDVTPGTTSLLYSSLTLYTDAKYAISIEYIYNDTGSKNVIMIGEGMDYEEIQDALNGIDDDSASNPYTFVVMPKGTPYKPFTTIRADFSASYPWNNIEPRNISIIGLDKEHCVIQSDSGDYYYPCAEPMLNGTIKNLKFIMTVDEQTETAVEGGFCLHIDCRTKDDAGYQMTIEDCDFENASAPCLGVGLHKNCDLKFVRCNFKTTLAADYNPHEGYRNLVDGGAVLSHSSTLATATNQHLSFIDCVGTCLEGDKSIQISNAGDYDPETAYFEYTLIRNVFWNYGLNTAGWSISNNITPSPYNYGNNMSN